MVLCPLVWHPFWNTPAWEITFTVECHWLFVWPPNKVRVLVWNSLWREFDWTGHFVVVKMPPMKKSGTVVIFGIHSIAEYITQHPYGYREYYRVLIRLWGVCHRSNFVALKIALSSNTENQETPQTSMIYNRFYMSVCAIVFTFGWLQYDSKRSSIELQGL